MEKVDRVAVLFQWLDREVVLVEVLVHFLFHLSIISSIFRQEQGGPTTSMSHIDLLLVQLSQFSALGFYFWSEVCLRLAIYCCTTPLVASSGVVRQSYESLLR